ncbi:tRNA pseudouridine synthase 1, partial [Spiromyces aspiralis]
RKTQITPPVLERVREALKQYEGTHDYMNFTVTRGCNEKNSKRYIHYFTASDPILINGTEWLSLKVKGQSFMLHQIRKMVGLVVLMIRFNTPVRVIGEIFKSPRINIPKAPSLGLLLEQPMFDAYNRHVTTKKHMSQNTEPIKFEPYREAIEKFKQDFIYNEIFGREFETNVFDKWVQWCELFPDQYSYLNDEGVVPESAYVSNQTNKEISNFLANLKAASGIDSQRDDRDDPQSDINE